MNPPPRRGIRRPPRGSCGNARGAAPSEHGSQGAFPERPPNERETMFNLRDVLDMAIQIERNGESVYRKALARTTDPDLVEMLAWMAEAQVWPWRMAENISASPARMPMPNRAGAFSALTGRCRVNMITMP